MDYSWVADDEFFTNEVHWISYNVKTHIVISLLQAFPFGTESFSLAYCKRSQPLGIKIQWIYICCLEVVSLMVGCFYKFLNCFEYKKWSLLFKKKKRSLFFFLKKKRILFIFTNYNLNSLKSNSFIRPRSLY